MKKSKKNHFGEDGKNGKNRFGGKMVRQKRKPRRHHSRPKRRLPFWEAVNRYGFSSALRYEFRTPRKYPKYPIWFIPMIVSMVFIAIILMLYPIDYFPYIFYLFEIIVVGYLIYRLLKKFDRIRIRGSNLRLYGLKMLSALVSLFGIYLITIPLIFIPFSFFERAINQESIFTQITTFGSQWHTPYIVPLFLMILGFGLCLIGSYLFFKFQRGSGNIIWVGRI